MTGYLPFTSVSYSGQAVSTFLESRFLHIKICKSAKNTKFADLQLICTIISVYYNCKTAKNIKFADLKNIEVGQRII